MWSHSGQLVMGLAGDSITVEVDCLAGHPTGLFAGEVNADSADIGGRAEAF